MEDDLVHQPHDKLFRSGFGDPNVAAGFLQTQLPAALASAISWKELRREEGSFIDSQFRASESDLLFSAPLHGRKAFIYILFEHQRHFDRWIALRLLRYMVRIWEDYCKATAAAEKLPLIVPVVLAQNATRWEIPTQFSKLIDLSGEVRGVAGQFCPEFTFRLIQLVEMTYDEMAGSPAAVLILRAFKAETMSELLAAELWDEALILASPSTFEAILRYILATGEVDMAAFDSKVQELQSAQLRATAMTLGQQYRQKGHQEGRQEAIIAILEARFADVPEGLREAILEIHEADRLQALIRSAATAGDIETFAQNL